MKGLKEFLELLAKDEELLKEVEKVQDDSKKVVKIAKEHGYEFTESEYDDLKMEAVSGGAGSFDLGSLLNQGLSTAGDFLTSQEGQEKITGVLNEKAPELLNQLGGLLKGNTGK